MKPIAIHRFNHLEKPRTLDGVLATLEEHLPGEIIIRDFTEVICTTERAAIIVEKLMEPVEQPLSLSARLTTSRSDHDLEEANQSLDTAIAELRAELVVQEDASQDQTVWPTCPECDQPFIPKRANSKFCSPQCAKRSENKRYRAERAKKNGKADPKSDQGESRRERLYLEIDTGKVINHTDLIAGMKSGAYPVGTRFRRNGNRLFEIEQKERRGRQTFHLKQVFE
jgi:hypothetical protein